MSLRFVGLAAFSALAVASPAYALEAGQCGPAAEIQAALKAESQVPVVIGNRVTTRKDRPVNIFTANSNRIGYELEGDAPQGQKSTRVCVVSRYHDVRLNDINSAVIPAWALIGNDRRAAEADCKSRQADLCDSYDDYVRRSHAAGRRIMLVAQTDHATADGSHRDGRLLTVIFKPDHKLAEVAMTNAAGASESGGVLESVSYTQFASSFIQAN